jgi:hypothetical protein
MSRLRNISYHYVIGLYVKTYFKCFVPGDKISRIWRQILISI